MNLVGISKTIVSIIVVVVIIVAGVAVFLVTQQKPPVETPTETPITTPTTTPVPPLKILISNVEIHVPPGFATFFEKAKSGQISVVIYFGHALAPEERPAFEKVISNFEREFPGIDVRIIPYGGMGDMQAAVVTACSLPPEQREQNIGNAPDVFTWAHDWVGWMADAGYLVALEDYIGYDAIDDIEEHIIPVAISAVRYGAKTYGLPYAGEALALFVNTKLVTQLPTTFSELKAIMEQFYYPAEGTYGISGQIGGMYHLNAWVTAFGGFWYNDATKELGLNKEETKEGLKFFIRDVLRYMDVTDLGHDYQRRLFGDEKAPIYISGPWDVSYAVRTLGLDNFIVIPFPKIDGRTPKPWGGFRNMYITTMAEAGGRERAYATILFVLYLTLYDDALLTLVNENGYVPVKLSVAEYVEQHRETHPIYKIVYGFYTQVLTTVPMPRDKNMQKVWGADDYIRPIFQEFSAALSEGKSVDEAVERAVGVVDSQLDQAYDAIAPKLTR